MSSALRAAVASESEKSIIEDVLESNANEHGLWRALSLFEIINRGSEDIISIHDAKGTVSTLMTPALKSLVLTPKNSLADAAMNSSIPRTMMSLIRIWRPSLTTESVNRLSAACSIPADSQE